jgi:hypothetical protein
MSRFTKAIIIAGSLTVLPPVANASEGVPVNVRPGKPPYAHCMFFQLLTSGSLSGLYYINRADTAYVDNRSFIAMSAGNSKVALDPAGDPNPSNCTDVATYTPNVWIAVQ